MIPYREKKPNFKNLIFVLDRYLAIIHPLKALSCRDMRKSVLISVSIWLCKFFKKFFIKVS